MSNTTKYIGETSINKQGLTGKIIKKTSVKQNTRYLYEVLILETGTVLLMQRSNFVRGNYKDYSLPSVYGVGYSDSFSNKSDKIYHLWAHILERCYVSRAKSYKTYGARGVKISDEWLHYSVFEKDVKELKNYDLWLEDSMEYTLDKDVMGNGLLYSKEYCSFINRLEQAQATRRVKKVKVTFNDGTEKIFNSINQCSKAIGYDFSLIAKNLKGTVKTKKYKFEEVI